MARLISNINDNRARYVAPVEISSSLTVTGSINHNGNFIQIGNYTHTGSINHSGSKFLTGIFSQTGSLSITGSTAITGSLSVNGLRYPLVDNGEFSFMQSDGLGNVTLQYVNTIYETVYNAEATTIVKGTPLYVSGSQGANSKVFRADAGNPNKMPVVYVAADNIAAANTGRGVVLGLITGVNTTGYSGGTEIYVAVGGSWTSIRPTGSAIIQVLGIVTKEGAGGQGVVLNPGPANLPNLNSGSVWVGNNNSFPTSVLTASLSVATASYINALQQDVQITGSLSTKGTFSVGRITTSNAVIQRSQAPAGAYSFIFAGGAGLSDTYPYTMADTHAATMELRAGDPTTDQYGGGIVFSANGHTSPLGEGNAIIFKNRTGVNTYTERMRVTSAGASIIGSVNATSFTGSLQGTSSYASTAKTISSQYLCQGKLNADQTINNSSDDIIQYVDQYDPNGWYDAGTYRFTPTVAGYYSISAGAWLESTVDTNNQMNLQGRKNGSTFAIVQSPTNGVTGQSLGFTKIVYFNGSGDYMDLTIYQNSGASKSLLAGTADGSGTWFSAHLIST